MRRAPLLAALCLAPLLGVALTAAPVLGAPVAAAPQDHGAAAHAAAEGHELTVKDIFGGLFGHLVPHEVTSFEVAGFPVRVFNINTVQWIAGGLLLLVMAGVGVRARKLDAGAPRGGWYGVMESMILFVRDDMVYAAIGKENGRPLVPFFLTQFFFILFLNLFGLLPDFTHGLMGTATANLAVTGGLALTSLVAIHALGIAEWGFGKHWKNFIPHVPWWLVPLMIVVELAGILVKPAALTIRLFANLTAGHLVVLGLFGLAYLTAAALGGVAGHAVGVLPVLMAIAIYGLELFVAFVQAYIFTYLTIVFVGASLHPEH